MEQNTEDLKVRLLQSTRLEIQEREEGEYIEE